MSVASWHIRSDTGSGHYSKSHWVEFSSGSSRQWRKSGYYHAGAQSSTEGRNLVAWSPFVSRAGASRQSLIAVVLSVVAACRLMRRCHRRLRSILRLPLPPASARGRKPPAKQSEPRILSCRLFFSLYQFQITFRTGL